MNGRLQVYRDIPVGGDARQLPRRRARSSTPPSRRSRSGSPSSSARWGSSSCNATTAWRSPTPSGRQLMVYAEKLIGLRSEMLAEVGDRSAMRGVLRLGVAETIVHTWLSRLIKSVNTAYPNLSLEIEVDITPNLRARLLAQEIELAFLLGPLSASDRAQPRPVRLSRWLSRQSFARPRQRSADGAGSREISDHYLSAQDPALRDRALAVQPARSAADPAACLGLARDRHPHGDRRARHRRDSRPRSSKTKWRTGGCNCCRPISRSRR